MKKYDVIIIGAGLAGCVLGYLLKKQNKKVLIVEQKDISKKSKLCGGIVTNKAYELLENIYDERINDLNFTKFYNGIIINNKKRISIDDINVYTVHRKDLDDFVLNEYLNSKGEIIDKTTYYSLDLNNQIMVINDLEYQFDYLVGADGVLSGLRRDLIKKNQKMNLALESNIKKTKHTELEINFFQNKKSYGWIIPNNKYTCVGIGDVSSKFKLEEDYDTYLKQIDISITDKKGAFLPKGKDILLEFNNVKFIGDAAGLISPITGEGIYYAIASAKILSQDLNKYKKNMKKIKRQIKKERFYKIFVYNNTIRNFIFNRHNNILFRKIINRFARKII